MNETYKFAPRELYIINTERDGTPSDDGQVKSSVAQMEAVVENLIKFLQEDQNRPGRVVFYFHGGLVDERRALDVMRYQYKTFLHNGIYPLYFIWESGLQDTFHDVLHNFWRIAFERVPIVTTALDSVMQGISPKDELIEEVCKGISGWNIMVERAQRVFGRNEAGERGFGWKFFEHLRKRLRETGLQPELHVIGHSAGGIVLGHLLQELFEDEPSHPPIATCSLYAPCITVPYFEQVYLRGQIRQFFLYTMTEQQEVDDSCIDVEFFHRPLVKIYGKSLLYLVSRGFGAQEGDIPLLGMALHAKDSVGLQELIAQGRGAHILSDHDREVRVTVHGVPLDLRFIQEHHGGFGTNSQVLNSTLKTLLLDNELAAPF